MTTTKTKKPIIYGDNCPITKFQINEIMRNCAYQVETKNEYVQWATGDISRTSLRSITQAEAIKIIKQQTGKKDCHTQARNDNWGSFNHKLTSHRMILSLLYQANITTSHETRGEVADMNCWFAKFLQSSRCPVNKPLLQMKPFEVSKIIVALEGVAIWKNAI